MLLLCMFNTCLTYLFHIFHACLEGNGWFGHLNMERGYFGLGPVKKFLFIVFPSPSVMSLE